MLKKTKLRYNEYYDMQSVFDKLYENSLAKREFRNLISIITSFQVLNKKVNHP